MSYYQFNRTKKLKKTKKKKKKREKKNLTKKLLNVIY